MEKKTRTKKTIRVVSMGKGGAGKTTTMSAYLHYLTKTKRNSKIFVLDADPAATLSAALGLDLPAKMGIGQLKEELSSVPVEGDKKDKMAFVLKEMSEKAIARTNINGVSVDFAVMGHHQEDHCMCAYNNAVNEALTALLESDIYDYIIIDREAGLEHINRSKSIYSDPNTYLLVVAWPNRSYLSVAKEVLITADALEATTNRLLIINNITGKALVGNRLNELLEEENLSDIQYVVMPQITGVDEAPIPACVDNVPAIENTLRQIMDTVDSIAE